MSVADQLNNVLKSMGRTRIDGAHASFTEILTITAANLPEGLAVDVWIGRLARILERLEYDGLIEEEALYKPNRREYWLTPIGVDFYKAGGFGKDTFSIELSNNNIRLLTMIMQVIPYHGTFDFYEVEGKISWYISADDHAKLLNPHTGKAIMGFLTAEGFALQAERKFILSDLGRALKKSGSLNAFKHDQHANQLRQRKREQVADELLEYEKKNEEWQKNTGQKIVRRSEMFVVFNLIVAVCNIVVTFYIAKYITKNEALVVRSNPVIIVDSTFLKPLLMQNKTVNPDSSPSAEKIIVESGSARK